MKKNVLVLLCFVVINLVSCAHHRDVRPGVDGVHRVVIKSDDHDKGTQDAIAQANHFCEQKGKSAAIISEEKKYTGSMSEDDYKTAKTASKVATAAGGMVHVFGGKNESTAGGIVGLGGIVGDAALGKAYNVEMKFKCL